MSKKGEFAAFLALAFILFSAPAFACIPSFDPSTPEYFNATEGIAFTYQFSIICNDSIDLPIIVSSDARSSNVSLNSFEMNTSGFINFTATNDDLTDLAKNGTYVVSFVVRNSNINPKGGLWFITFSIRNTNNAPNITNAQPSPPSNATQISYTLKEGQTLILNASVEDPDLLTYLRDNETILWLVDDDANASLEKLNYSNATVTSPYNATVIAGYTPGFSDALGKNATIHNVTLYVTDSGNLTAVHTWFINVTNTNRAPEHILNFSMINLTEDTLSEDILTMEAFFRDNDTDDYPLQYGIDFLDGNAFNFNVSFVRWNTTWTNLSIRPMNYFNGNATARFYAFDGLNTTYGNNVTLQVFGVNNAPIVQNISNQTAFNGEVFSLQVNATDVENDTLIFTNSHTEIFNITQTGLITFTASSNITVVHLIEINVSDGMNTTTVQFYLTIKENTIPWLLPINATVAVEDLTYEANLTGVDDDDPVLNFTTDFPYFGMVRLGPQEVSVSFAATQRIIDEIYSGVAAGNIPTSHTKENVTRRVNVTVFDPRVSNSTNYTLTIINVPHAPALQPMEPRFLQLRIDKNYLITLNATDADTYPGMPGNEYYFYDNSSLFATENATGMINVTFNASQIGNYSILLTVVDISGLSSSVVWNLSVLNNSAPYFTDVPANPFICDKGWPCAFTVNATDNESDTLSFFNNLTQLYAINATTGVFNFTPNRSQIGNYTEILTVSDGNLNSTYAFNLSIIDANTPPYFLPPLENYSEWLGIAEEFTTTIVAFAYDDENDTLNFSGLFNGNSSFPMDVRRFGNSTNTAQITLTPALYDIGPYSVNITVTDGVFNTTTTVNFTVNHTNHAPTIPSTFAWVNGTNITFTGTNLSVNETQTLYINATLSDVDISYANDSLSVVWYIDGVANRSVTNVTYGIDQYAYAPPYGSAGTHNITVMITDTFNSSASVEFAVNVSKTNRPVVFGRFSYSSQDFLSFSRSNISVAGGLAQLSNNGSEYALTGSMDSSTIDFQENEEYLSYGTLGIGSSVPNATALLVRFSSGQSNLSMAGSYPVAENQTITAPVKQYLKYTVAFSTNDSNATPSVANVTVGFGIANITIQQGTIVSWVRADHFFLDPDLDTLNYTVSGNTNIQIEVNASTQRVRIIPNADFVGEETIQITATDGYSNATSNPIKITVLEAEQQNQQQIVYISSGGSSTNYVPIPMPQEVEKKTFIGEDMLIVRNVTTLENDSALIAITFKNLINTSMRDVKLTATTDNPYANATIFPSSFLRVPADESRELLVSVESYKTWGAYQVFVTLTADEPKTNMSKTIFVSSYEKGEQNKTQLNTKIAFAKDLLETNPACLELYETLGDIQKLVDTGKQKEASEKLQMVISDCNYLIQRSKEPQEQRPQATQIPWSTILLFGGIAFVVMASLWVSYNLVRLRSRKGEKD